MPDNYGKPIIYELKAPHDMILFIRCLTGYVGEESESWEFVHAGCDLGQLSLDLAINNGMDFAGQHGGDEEDEEEYLQDCYACLYHYQLTESGSHVQGGNPINDIIYLLIRLKVIRLERDYVVIDAVRLKELVYIPEEDALKEYKYLFEHIKELYGVKNYKLFLDIE